MTRRIGLFETMQKHYQQRDLAAREWKDRGGKLAGYFFSFLSGIMLQPGNILTRVRRWRRKLYLVFVLRCRNTSYQLLIRSR